MSVILTWPPSEPFSKTNWELGCEKDRRSEEWNPTISVKPSWQTGSGVLISTQHNSVWTCNIPAFFAVAKNTVVPLSLMYRS